jgi:hypothetical protein
VRVLLDVATVRPAGCDEQAGRRQDRNYDLQLRLPCLRISKLL